MKELSERTKIREDLAKLIGFGESSIRKSYYPELRKKYDELERTQKELATQKANLQGLFDSINDMIFVLTLDGKILTANPSVGKMLGFSQSELQGHFFLQLLKREDEPAFREALDRCVSENSSVSMLSLVDHMGHGIPVEASLSLGSWNGSPAIFGVSRDMTEHTSMERELKKAKETAESANQEKSRFLASVTHEIRTPLQAIFSAIELFGRHTFPPEVQRLLTILRTSSLSLLRIVNDILDLGKLENGTFELVTSEFSVSDIVSDVLTTLSARLADKKLEIGVYTEHEASIRLMGDEGRLRQVIENLVSNAIKYTQEGAICISISKTSHAEPLLRIEVSDSGQGIPADKLEHIFDIFTQLETGFPRQEGVGVGLAVVKKLVHLMGGYLDVRSEVGKGSTFVVHLPFHEAPAQTEPEQVTHFRDFKREDVGVLVAEDSPVIRELIETLLEMKGYAVKTVTNGKEAVDAFDKENSDVILMDVQMPILDGLQAARLIRHNEKGSVPVILGMTALARDSAQESCLAAGMDGIVPKPISAELLDQEILRALSSKRAVVSARR